MTKKFKTNLKVLKGKMAKRISTFIKAGRGSLTQEKLALIIKKLSPLLERSRKLQKKKRNKLISQLRKVGILSKPLRMRNQLKRRKDLLSSNKSRNRSNNFQKDLNWIRNSTKKGKKRCLRCRKSRSS